MATAAACGGSTTGPTPPPNSSESPPTAPTAPVEVRAFDGATDAPVGAAIDPLDGSVRVTAPGYLVRVQVRAPSVFLWPAPEPDRVREVAFGHAGARLMRWDVARPFRHCVVGEGVDVATVQRFSATMTDLSGIAGTVAIGESPLCNVTWAIDPAGMERFGAQGAAVAVLSGAGPVIVAARVLFRDVAAVEDLGLHEAGHVLGLSHSSYREDLMHATPRAGGFSAVEVVALRMMYRHRQPGATFPEG